jgi:hypothetical protein
MSILTLRPVSDGNKSGWAPVPDDGKGGPDCYTVLDEVTTDFADYVQANSTSGVLLDFGWTDHGSESGTISEIIMYVHLGCGDLNPNSYASIKFYAPDSGHQSSTTHTVWNTEGVLEKHEHFPINPHTGVAWTWADIDELNAGINGWIYYGDKNTGFMDIYQMWLEVVYSDAVSFAPQVSQFM